LAVELVVSTAAASAVTVTSSAALPISRRKSTAATAPTCSGTASRFMALNPSLLTDKLYKPIGSLGRLYRPASLLIVVLLNPVLCSVTVTDAAGTTAPDESVIFPLREAAPISVWAVAGIATKRIIVKPKTAFRTIGA